MTERFEKLDAQKKKTILDAAYEEFGEQGYENASTNRIVKKAGIGKGMLFYYFNSKKELFHYLIMHGMNYIINEYLNKLDETEADFIEKYRYASKIKFSLYQENPHIFNYFGTLYINQYEYLSEEIKVQLTGMSELGYAKTFNNIDTSLFREDIDSEQLIRLINLTMSGYQDELMNKLKGKKLYSHDMKPYWDDFDEFLATLKKIYYK